MNYFDLPVYKNHQLILSALEKNQAVVVESPTGSGKTTQLPVILHEAGYSQRGIIGVTQPRRIAAVSVSEFIERQFASAQFAGSQFPAAPGLVGYKMRFEDRTNHNTKIKIMTDGILLQEMKLDPWLSKYSLLVVDEAHERSLNIDFVLGLLKRVLETRHDFKVVISSATINAVVFSQYFGECPIVKIDAQGFPVTLIYEPPAAPLAAPFAGRDRFETGGHYKNGRNDYSGRGRGDKLSGDGAFGGALSSGALDALLEKILGIVTRFMDEKRDGDILVFLPGEKMIKDCMNLLASSPFGGGLHILPLYGRLAKEEQERVFEKAPKGKTKVIISTNIAETSVTIDGVTAVIDSGLSKLNWYNPHTFTSSLVEAPISKASANQRKGRAGRTREGTCYRLYNRRDFENRPLFTTEEIFRTDLSEVILRMADLGITNFESFDFIAAPERAGIIAGIETLNLLEALEPDRSLSTIGKMMTEFPLAPRHSRIITEAIMKYPDVLYETLIAAAFLSTQSPYILPPGEESDARLAHQRFQDPAGDFVSYLKLFRAYADSAQSLPAKVFSGKLFSANKHKFCEKNYLDERAMAEIANVVAQLEEIVAGMGIPVHHGKWPLSPAATDDYLCCIARGMIQFVCAREGRGRAGSYHSLTADKIIIHPGSVMFRMDPPFIVAGEVVRTTRMYAMSVSPVSKEILERISVGLFGDFLAEHGRGEKRGAAGGAGGAGGGEPRREKLKKARDFTNSIKISGEIFEIKTIKGKKTVILPWENLKAIQDSIPAETVYKGLKGTVLVSNCSLLAGEKLELILSLAPSLDADNALKRKWPRKEKFNSQENLDGLLLHLDSLVKPAVWKKGSKELGFLGLFSDGAGTYWLRCSRGFHTSLHESLSSLDILIGELGDDVDIGVKHIVNQCYRRLSDYLS
ncbi:MAG: ATP-dependent RNA helicase [Spirochaetes bacterium]|nr:ATP-dependent RNA helicase [Spirochaetota bacterium]